MNTDNCSQNPRSLQWALHPSACTSMGRSGTVFYFYVKGWNAHRSMAYVRQHNIGVGCAVKRAILYEYPCLPMGGTSLCLYVEEPDRWFSSYVLFELMSRREGGNKASYSGHTEEQRSSDGIIRKRDGRQHEAEEDPGCGAQVGMHNYSSIECLSII